MKKIFIYLFFCIALISFAYADCSSLNNSNLISYYPFDSDTKDYKDNWNGTNNGVSFVSGMLGNAILFNSSQSDSILLNDITYFDLATQPISFTFGIKLGSYQSNGMILDKLDVTGTVTGFSLTTDATSGKIALAFFDVAGKLLHCRSDTALTLNTWEYWTIVYDGDRTDCTSMKFYKNNVLTSTITLSDTNPTENIYNNYNAYFGKRDDGSPNYYLNGSLDEFGIFDYALNTTHIGYLFNEGNLCNPLISDNVTETTPPTITFNNQNPEDLTSTNIFGKRLNITYNISDVSGINLATVKINLTVNNSYFIENRTRYNMKISKSYNFISGNTYNFIFDDNDVYSAIYLLNESYMETAPHSTYNLIGQNNYIKIKFTNISNTKSYTFYEGMTQNATIDNCLTRLYYCNSTYTTGSPILSPYCTLFYSGINNYLFNHTHIGGNSKHKIYSMGISNNMVNNIGVTPTSYILVRGDTCSNNWYYVGRISQIGDTQISGNGGNSYSNFAGTFDAHMHQINDNESINYNVCASDNYNNSACSSFRTDLIQLAGLPPTSVNIFSPTTISYIESLNVSHSISVSPNGYSIVKYLYYYSKEPYSYYTLFYTNTIDEFYQWWFTNQTSGNYKLKIVAYDSLNQTSDSYSEIFSINIPLTLTENLLTSINNTVYNINENVFNIYEVLKMSSIYIILLVMFMSFLYMGLFTDKRYFLIIDSFIFLVLGSLMYFEINITSQARLIYQVTISVFTILGTIALLMFGAITTFKKESEDKPTYDYRDVYYKK